MGSGPAAVFMVFSRVLISDQSSNPRSRALSISGYGSDDLVAVWLVVAFASTFLPLLVYGREVGGRHTLAIGRPLRNCARRIMFWKRKI